MADRYGWRWSWAIEVNPAGCEGWLPHIELGHRVACHWQETHHDFIRRALGLDHGLGFDQGEGPGDDAPEGAWRDYYTGPGTYRCACGEWTYPTPLKRPASGKEPAKVRAAWEQHRTQALDAYWGRVSEPTQGTLV